MLTRGSDHLEVGGAGDWYETLGAGAVTESSSDVAELVLDSRVRRGARSPLLGQLGIDPLCVRNQL